MNAHAVSTQVLSGTFKHGAGRIIVLALGSAVVAAAVVAAVAVRPSPGGDTSAPATSNAALLGAARAQHDALIDGTAAQFPAGSVFAVSRATVPQDEIGYRTTYIVGSQEQADAVALGINDANTIRAASGESPTLDTVLVVSSDAEAAAAMEAVADGNRILVTLGEPEEYVVDLRGGVGGWLAPSSGSDSDVSARMNSPLYPASREGVRGHVGIDPSLGGASESVQSTSRLTNYPASREGVRGHVTID